MMLRRTVTALFAIAAVGIVSAAAAFACTNLATLNLSKATGNSSDVVTVTGSSFAVPRASDAIQAPTPVVLHWNGIGGPELATVIPDSAGNISATFAIPQGSPGSYVVIATQRDAKGVNKYGTPARASFQILGAAGQAAVQQPGSQTPAPMASEPSSSGMLALTVGLGALGLILFGAAFTSVVRQVRSREVPATAPVHRD